MKKHGLWSYVLCVALLATLAAALMCVITGHKALKVEE